MKKILILLIFAMLIACTTKQPVKFQETQIIIPEEKIIPDNPRYEPPPTTPYTENMREILIEAKANQFIPSEITIKKGEIIRLTILSLDSEYTFNILDYDVDEKLKPGEEAYVDILANQAGIFTYYSETDNNMKGKLIIK